MQHHLKKTVQPLSFWVGNAGQQLGAAEAPGWGAALGCEGSGWPQARAGPWGTYEATFCHVGWKATGQGPVISWGSAGGETQRVRWSRHGVFEGVRDCVCWRSLHVLHLGHRGCGGSGWAGKLMRA